MRFNRLFDNPGTIFFAAVMSIWAVLFLEMWKRKQFLLQHHWGMLGYEAAEVGGGGREREGRREGREERGKGGEREGRREGREERGKGGEWEGRREGGEERGRVEERWR